MGSRGVQTAERTEVTCAHPECSNTYQVRRKRYEDGRGRYCSPQCRDNAPRSKRGKYVKHKDNPTAFKPGITPWNKGRPGVMPDPWNKGIQTGQVPPNVFRPSPVITYGALHAELRRQRGPASAHPCAQADATCKGPMHWANISGSYTGLDDFTPLCQSHHIRHDKANGTWGTGALWAGRAR